MRGSPEPDPDMFETAELGQRVSKEEFRHRAPVLRRELLDLQSELRSAPFPVILLFGGVDGAGKGESANLLSAWMDPRGIVTRAYGRKSEEEEERPHYWRYWRDLPPRGQIGIFMSAWYTAPLLDRVYGRDDDETLDDRLDRIVAFERTLADDGALILKFWMHLGKREQKERFETLEADPLQAWRVTKRDWRHWRKYEAFVSAAERLLMRTSTGEAPWEIVEGADHHYRSLRVGTLLRDALHRKLRESVLEANLQEASPASDEAEAPEPLEPPQTILSTLDMTLALEKRVYKRRLKELQARLNLLYRRAKEQNISTVLVFQGWDAAGKGGAIRRLTAAMDARDYQVISIAAPTDEELAHHYLWRFWRHLPRSGRVTVFDRSWYGRVLVERVEGFATEAEWRRAYAEINDFEHQLIEDGSVLLKFWLHVTPEEQARRFESREETPHKQWKLTEEDWRNRERWHDYELAVHEMVERCSTNIAPWTLVEGDDKRFARVRVIETVCDALEKRLGPAPDGDAGRKGTE